MRHHQVFEVNERDCEALALQVGRVSVALAVRVGLVHVAQKLFTMFAPVIVIRRAPARHVFAELIPQREKTMPFEMGRHRVRSGEFDDGGFDAQLD